MTRCQGDGSVDSFWVRLEIGDLEAVGQFKPVDTAVGL